MNLKLFYEYIIVQGCVIVFAYFGYKRLRFLLKNNEKNGYGIGSALGVILGAILVSFVAFYSTFIERKSFVAFLIDTFIETFK